MPEDSISLSPPSAALQDEFELLCRVCRPQLGQDATEQLAGLAPSSWETLIRLADGHGVLPVAARTLAEYQVPADVAETLRAQYRANLARSLMFAGKLIEIQHTFERGPVRAVPYKGVVLAQLAYGDLGLRRFSDLDFLVHPADFGRAQAALAEVGYTPSKVYPPAVERFLFQTGYERAFDGKDAKNIIELQWALLPRFYAVDLAVEDLIARAGKVTVGDQEVACLSPEDSLLVVCLHAAKHLWTKLIWLVDIAQSLRVAGLDFRQVAARARQAGILRIMGVSLRLSEKLLGAEIPQAARELIARDAEEARLADEFARRLAAGAGYDLDSTGYFHMIGRLRERAGDRLRYYWRLTWTPGEGDLAAAQLPQALFPLYRVVRVGRLVKRAIV